MKKLAVALAMCLYLVGCATSGQLAKLPPITDPGKAGKAVIIRNFNFFGAGVEYGILLDGKKIYTLATKQYTIFDLNYGSHILGLECPNGWGGTKTKNKAFNIKGNDVFYYLLSPSTNGCDIEWIDEDDGKDRMASSQFRPAAIEERVAVSPAPTKTGSALDILKQRYANGEISVDQYQKMKQTMGE